MYEHDADRDYEIARAYIREGRYEEARIVLQYSYSARNQKLLRRIDKHLREKEYFPIQRQSRRKENQGTHYKQPQQVVVVNNGRQVSGCWAWLFFIPVALHSLLALLVFGIIVALCGAIFYIILQWGELMAGISF